MLEEEHQAQLHAHQHNPHYAHLQPEFSTLSRDSSDYADEQQAGEKSKDNPNYKCIVQ